MTTSNSQVALVTGAGTGIGQAIAITLANHGFAVALVGRRLDALLRTAALLPEGIEHLELTADVSDASRVVHTINQTMQRLGRLDVLVNNAGFAPMLPIDETSFEIIDEVYRTNALAPAYLIAKAWPIFKQQHREQGTGACIINISTLGTLDPFEGFFAYAAAKAAVNLMAKSCAKEGKDIGVRAFSIAPGAVETGMLRSLFTESEMSPQDCLSPFDIAEVVFACVSGQRDSQNGETIPVTR
jgi:NAD(P)-dependent dehydrogenase (short-subunit alcohol dehydrogenase family)